MGNDCCCVDEHIDYQHWDAQRNTLRQNNRLTEDFKFADSQAYDEEEEEETIYTHLSSRGRCSTEASDTDAASLCSVKLKDPSERDQQSTVIQAHNVGFKENMKFKRIDSLRDLYETFSMLGEGSFGCVYEGRHKKTQMPCAIKQIAKAGLRNDLHRALNRNEFQVLEVTHHPHITRVYELMHDADNYYIVSELVTGGDLKRRQEAQPRGRFSDSEAASIIRQVLLALNYLHKKNIMHRDLKPANIMSEAPTRQNGGELQVKLTDFGFAAKYDPYREDRQQLGSPYWMAPELCGKEPHSMKVDCWAVGVIAFQLLAGDLPFKALDRPSLYARIRTEQPSFSQLRGASREARRFIEDCLTKNPHKRPSVETLLTYSWVS